MTSFNINSVTKTKLYRTMRDRIKDKIPSMSESSIRDLIGPMVQQHIDQESQRKEATAIAVSVLNEIEAASLVVQAGGKVVSKTSPKRKRVGGPKPKTAEEIADFTVLMEQFVLCYHEKNLEKRGVAKALGVSTSSVGNWLTNDGFPNMVNARAIRNLLIGHSYRCPSRFNPIGPVSN
jgi:predicted XRE-type DNA-binding protein